MTNTRGHPFNPFPESVDSTRAQHTTMPRPLIGVATLIIRDSKLLLGKRKGAHGAGNWACPGGHLEFGESIEACAAREVLEETGLVIRNIQRVAFTNDIFVDEGKHYVTLFVMADADGEPRVLEPEKCEGWAWFGWDALPEPLFMPLENLRASHENRMPLG